MKLVQCPEKIIDLLDEDRSSKFMSSLYQQKKFFCQEYGPLIFLGGGITSCPLWQDVMIDLLKDENCVLFNPRRVNWNSTIESREQIEWENIHLKMADKIVFWFPCETLCPITLFELGKYLVSDKQIFVGCHRKYNKRNDVVIQVGLERPDLIIHDSLKSLSKEISNSL